MSYYYFYWQYLWFTDFSGIFWWKSSKNRGFSYKKQSKNWDIKFFQKLSKFEIGNRNFSSERIFPGLTSNKCCQPRKMKFCGIAKFRLFFCGLFLGWKSMYFSNLDMQNDETHFWMTFFTKNYQKSLVFDENHEKSMRNFRKSIFYQW